MKTKNEAEADEIPTIDGREVLIGSELAEPVGSRLPQSLRRDGRQNPRPHGDRSFQAELVRGVSFTISYAGGSLVLEKGKQVPVNETEFAHLSQAVDRIDFSDGEGRVQRSIRKFRFFDADGEPLVLEPIPDEHLDQAPVDMFERAAHEKRFEGSEFTAR